MANKNPGSEGKILLVDDDPGLLRLLSIRLRAEGYEVEAAESGMAALNAATRNHPDLVISDLKMDGMDGIDLLGPGRRPARRRIQAVFQDPLAALSPRRTVLQSVREPLDHLRLGAPSVRRADAARALETVGLEPQLGERYPHELSGGQRQRVAIARALGARPRVVIADEPTSALDVTVQAQITELVGRLRAQTRMSIILITHDLAAVAEVSDRIIVMYAGEMVETGTVDDIFYRPQHPYTRGLLASVPRLDRVFDDELQTIPGNPPNLLELPSGCRFRDRCSEAMEECRNRPPMWRSEDGRASRCFLPMEGGQIEGAEPDGGDGG